MRKDSRAARFLFVSLFTISDTTFEVLPSLHRLDDLAVGDALFRLIWSVVQHKMDEIIG